VSKAAKRERQRENRERAREERERMMKRQRQMKTLRSLAFVLVPIMAILIIISLTSSNDSSASAAFNPKKFYTATIETSEGTIVVALDHSTPKATGAFVKFAEEKKYDGLCIDRISRDFVIQGGSKGCDQQTNLGPTVKGEVPTDHYPVGSLAAAKTGSDPAGTFGGQFFIVTGSQGATLPNDYARFGSVISGLDVAQKIEGLPIKGGANDGPPASKITIKRIRVKASDTAPSTTTTVPAASSTTATSAPPASSTTTASSSTTSSSLPATTTTSSTPTSTTT
jgi:peptidyl-prolyl cis-trans isomerase B (cyclophilin B)